LALSRVPARKARSTSATQNAEREEESATEGTRRESERERKKADEKDEVTGESREEERGYGKEVFTHLTKLLDLIRSSNLLGLERKLDDVEVCSVKVVGFEEVLLLHLLTD